MTVTLTDSPTLRPFAAYADPGLPEGYWASHLSLLGDATGGLQSINIRMSASAQPNPSTIWSLEQLAIFHGTGGGLNIRMDYGGFDVFPVGSSSSTLLKLLQIALFDLGTASSGSAMNLVDTKVSTFLGSARKDVNVDLSFDSDNADGVGFSVFAQGYYWGPGAINAPGGPRRPVEGLYHR